MTFSPQASQIGAAKSNYIAATDRIIADYKAGLAASAAMQEIMSARARMTRELPKSSRKQERNNG